MKNLMNEGCNTNIISASFVNRNRKYMKIIDKDVKIARFNEGPTELSLGILMNAEV